MVKVSKSSNCLFSEVEIKRMKLQEEKKEHPERFGIDGKRRSWKQRH